MKKLNPYFSNLLYSASCFEEKMNLYNDDDIKLDEEVADRLIEKWIKIGFRGKADLFQKKLSFENIDIQTLRKVAAAQNIQIDESDLPEWFNLFIKLSEFLNSSRKDYLEDEVTKNTNQELPFLQIMKPFADFTFNTLKQKLGDTFNLLNEEAEESIRWNYLMLCFNQLNQALFQEFNLFKLRRLGPFAKIITNMSAKDSDKTYKEFVEYFFDKRLEEFFTDYPLLAKLVSISLMNAISHYFNILSRFENDLSEIEATILNSKSGKISGLQTSLSDNHDSGQSVCIIHFETGLRIVYKPKNLEIDKSFFKLLGYINSLNILPDFFIPKMITRNEYGWVEFIDSSVCKNRDEVERYYERMGCYIFLIYLLNGNDYHLENLIAHGEHPVLIDLETIMHHPVVGKSVIQGKTAMSIVANELGSSVFKTGLLPRWDLIGENKVIDISGLGSYGNQEAPYQRIEWAETNTDKMHIARANYVIDETANLPMIEGEVQLPNLFLKEIVAGFQTVYNYFQDNKNTITFDSFMNKKIRYVFRSTNDYGILIRQLAQTRNQDNGLSHDYFSDLLSYYVLSSDIPDSPILWKIFLSEKAQLIKNDFPAFYSFTNSKNLIGTDGTIIEEAFEVSAYDRFTDRLKMLNEKDCNKQIEYIKGSLYFRELKTVDHYDNLRTKLLDNSEFSFDKEILSEEAIKIAERIIERRVVASDGSVSWMGVGYNSDIHVSQFQPMGIGLYDGLSGVALFLAAVYHHTKNEKYKEAFCGTIKSLKQFLDSAKKSDFNKNGLALGVAAGITSVIYSLILSSDFMNDKTIIDLAEDFYSLIDDELIEKDNTFDIISGSSGAILGLLKLHSKTKKEEVLRMAVRIGDHLLKNRIVEQNKFKVWKTGEEEKILTGFSHGQAGIIHSLIKLSWVTNSKRFYDAAMDAFEYENFVYDEKEKNWPDFRRELPNGEKSYMNAWCHGAAGIGHSRLELIKYDSNLPFKKDVDAVIENTLHHDILVADHICCGNLSLINFLFEAGSQLNNFELADQAKKRVFQMIGRARDADGNYNLFHDPTERIFNPGFFQGLSGIGYYLLRYANVEDYPNVLTFE